MGLSVSRLVHSGQTSELHIFHVHSIAHKTIALGDQKVLTDGIFLHLMIDSFFAVNIGNNLEVNDVRWPAPLWARVLLMRPAAAFLSMWNRTTSGAGGRRLRGGFLRGGRGRENPPNNFVHCLCPLTEGEGEGKNGQQTETRKTKCGCLFSTHTCSHSPRRPRSHTPARMLTQPYMPTCGIFNKVEKSAKRHLLENPLLIANATHKQCWRIRYSPYAQQFVFWPFFTK